MFGPATVARYIEPFQFGLRRTEKLPSALGATPSIRCQAPVQKSR